MVIEHYKPEYANQIADIYNNTIHFIAAADYTKEELDAWAPAPIEYDKWIKRLEIKKPFVAVDNDVVLGFGELETGGHIDCFYTHKDHQRKGIGKAILNHIESVAKENKYPKLFAEVSITAKPFFLSMGFKTIRPNLSKKGLKNYLMEKSLDNDEQVFFEQLKLVDNNLILIFCGKSVVTAPDSSIMAYRFIMKNVDSGKEMGGINIKAGYTENITHYRGNIGFTVYDEFRGHHYSARSCKLLLPVIKFLGLNPIWFTCDVENIPSEKSIVMTGAKYLETITIMADSPYYSFYPEESKTKKRFKWEIE